MLDEVQTTYKLKLELIVLSRIKMEFNCTKLKFKRA